MKKNLCICFCVILLALCFPTAYAKPVTPPTNIRVHAKSAGFVISFSKSKSKVTGYIIKFSPNKNFSNNKSIRISSSKTSKTIKRLKAGKKYYVKVCALKGSTKSKWTKTKSVITKAKSLKSIAVKGLWYLYSPQDYVADVFNLYDNGSCKHMSMSCMGNKVDQYSCTVVRSCKIGKKRITVNVGSKKYVIKYVRSGDYGKYTTTLASGPMDPQKVTFKVFHYPDHPSVSRFKKDWNNKFI